MDTSPTSSNIYHPPTHTRTASSSYQYGHKFPQSTRSIGSKSSGMSFSTITSVKFGTSPSSTIARWSYKPNVPITQNTIDLSPSVSLPGPTYNAPSVSSPSEVAKSSSNLNVVNSQQWVSLHARSMLCSVSIEPNFRENDPKISIQPLPRLFPSPLLGQWLHLKRARTAGLREAHYECLSKSSSAYWSNSK